MFPGVDLTGMLAVPTCQHSDVDLVRTGEKIEQEKDRLLERVSSSCSDGGQSAPSILRCILLLPLLLLHFKTEDSMPPSLSIIPPCSMHMQFMDWSKAICELLVSWGFWADYIDPCSGLPVRPMASYSWQP